MCPFYLEMKLDIQNLKDPQIIKLVQNRYSESDSLWKIVTDEYKKNSKFWSNDKDLYGDVAGKKSKVTDNRIFLAIETVISNLTARPSKPEVLPGNESPESGKIASDLQSLFLEKYRKLAIKKKIRKGIRWLLLARLICLKMIWDNDLDDYDVEVVDPRKIRFSKKCTSNLNSKFSIEDITITISEMIDKFPDKKDEILKVMGGKNVDDVLINNQEVTYQEAWLNGGEDVVCIFRNKVLSKSKNPYWDWDGVFLTKGEANKFDVLKGPNERVKAIASAKGLRDKRVATADKYQNYLFNHFDKPYAPYIFDTILDVEDGPVGQTSLAQQTRGLQMNVNDRKRQISDNAAEANGRWLVDTALVQVKSKGEFQNMKSNPGGIIFGKGIKNGLTIISGRDLPKIVIDDLTHSVNEIESIFGTQPTFRGEQGKGTETATGRAILREQSFQRLNELVDVVDNIHLQLYNWMMQMMKVRYSETHYTKILGKDRAISVIEILNDSLEDGIEIKIVPGQMLPEDKIFKADRALEAVKAGLIIPLKYYEDAQYDNPMEVAKQTEMYKISPFSVLNMDKEDIKNLEEGIALQKQLEQAVQPEDGRAGSVSEMRGKIQAMVESDEFKQLPPEEQQQKVAQMRNQVNNLIKAGQGEDPTKQTKK